jgi:D-alanine-D-alanine ligase
VAQRRERADALCREIVEALSLPLFVKPSNGGSSLGIRKVGLAEELDDAIRFALEYDREVIVERGVDAREIECAVLGNDDPQASGLGEIVPAGEFYDYVSKYEDPASQVLIPAELDPELAETIRGQAVEGYRAHQLRGFARVDFLVERGTDRVFLNEVNTLPGFTPISMFPKLWEARGLPFPALLERLVELAREES